MKLDPRFKRLFENWPAKMLCFAAAVALFFFNRFNRLVEDTVQVPVRVLLNETFVPSTDYPEVVGVKLRGEKETIDSIGGNDFVAVLDLRKYAEEGEYQVDFSIQRSGNALKADPLEAFMVPSGVTIALERKLVKTVPIEPVFRGYLESGYEIERIELVPDRIEISGPYGKVTEVRSVGTEEIELGGRLGNFTSSVKLAPTERMLGISGPVDIMINIFVRKATATRSFEDVQVVAINVRPGLSFAFAPSVGTVTLNGPQLELDGLDAASLILTVDAGSIDKPGVYELPLIADPPSAFALEGFAPLLVTVTVTHAEGG